MKHAPGFLAVVNKAKENIKETDVQAVAERLERGERFHFVDVREDKEWAEGHLPDAVHIGKGVIERDIEAKIPDKESEIVLYCGGGFRSALAAEMLMKMGYKNVVSMDGGFRGWAEAGFPIKK